jgi:hypothetical protein
MRFGTFSKARVLQCVSLEKYSRLGQRKLRISRNLVEVGKRNVVYPRTARKDKCLHYVPYSLEFETK